MKSAGLHTEIQFNLLKLGEALGLQVWVAGSDRNKKYNGTSFSELSMEELPPSIGFNKEIIRTIRNIDVIWFSANKIECAFEIEVTTSIYSGVLRLSDLLALVPNINFPIYIVSPKKRKDKVKRELLRPTFKRLKLDERCKYIASEVLFKNLDKIVFSETPRSIEKIATKIKEIPKTLPEEGEVWYIFYFDPFDKVPNITKKKFFQKHGIKSFMAYAYLTDSKGENTGIVFQGYKNRIDARIEANIFRWGTRKQVNTNELKMGMNVYVVETVYDMDTREKLATPKIRMAGALKEVWLEKDGKKVEKLFPS